ncbi:MFS transporter [Streptomyces pluripotens]|uniref:MFS transporter n=1 Tax=Streptomyces pluripotens TaxID=1355015 RepID=A0A221P771_9ACTN|nr:MULTISPECIES: MFS transporter [Streptomyces]ARP73810.1 MFS transporter [Streptomyces pluripotens]ASN28057.1 MFS transporter [Streptomyces pluripotens]MCH0559400.1 MFS transporter [Streptomyces sp. MUM 16J]
MSVLASYRQLRYLPKFGPTLVAAVAGKLKPGVSSLALLLEVAHYRGLGQAAVAVSVTALAGVTLPLRGRLMDRHGYTHGMAPALMVYLMSLAVLVLNEHVRGPFAVTLAVAFVSGTSAPPIQTATRLIWQDMTTDALRTTALSLDTMLTDLGFIVGPTIAAFLVVTVAPWAGVAASALLCTVATLLLLLRGVPRRSGPPRQTERHWLGPLRSRAVRRTMAAAVFFFLGVRAIELAFPVWAQRHGMSLMSGVLLSCMSVGSVAGGLVLGALPARWSARATLPVTLVVLCVGTLLVAAASFTGTAVLAVTAALMGVALGPSFVALWATAGELTPANTAAETMAWNSSFMSLGGAVGAALGSVVARVSGPGGLLVFAALALATGAGLAHLALIAAPAERESTPGVGTRADRKATTL